MMTGEVADNAVPFAIPVRFLLTGVTALALAFTVLTLRPNLLLGSYTAPPVLALVHTMTLGFATMVFVGAMHQLAPVLFVTPLHSDRLGKATYGLLILGSAGVIAGFATGYHVWLLTSGGSLVLLGLFIFLYNLLRTARRASSHDAASWLLISATIYLNLAATLGLFIVLSRVLPGLAKVLGHATPLHLGLGLFGAFFLAIAGAGHKLLGMFVLAHKVSQWRIRIAPWLVHLALIILFFNTLFQLGGVVLTFASLLIALLLFGMDVRVFMKSRLRKAVEWPIRHYLLAVGFLPLTMVLMALQQVPAAVYSLLGGFTTLAIAGMLVKITSFLTWQYRYSAKVGRETVPMLRDMVQPGLERLSFWGLGLGTLGIILTLIQPSVMLAAASAFVSALGAWGLLGQMLWIVFRKHQRREVNLLMLEHDLSGVEGKVR